MALTKAFEQIGALTTKPMCVQFAQANEAKTVGDLVEGFDVLCANQMNHRRGFWSEPIVPPAVGRMACRHAHAYLQTLPLPGSETSSEASGEEAKNPSANEMCT